MLHTGLNDPLHAPQTGKHNIGLTFLMTMLHAPPPPPNYTPSNVDANTTCNIEAHITEYAKAHITSEGEDTHLCNALNTSSNAHTHTQLINAEVQTTSNAETHITG